MRNYVYYQFANITIQVSFDFEYLAENSYMNQFIVYTVEEPDYCFEFHKTNSINSFLKKTPNLKSQFQKFHYYQDQHGNEQCFHLKDHYYHAVTNIGEKHGYCYYICFDWLKESVTNGYYLENFLCLEQILMKFQCMILHSCHIQKNGKSILFSAPSGTGKSTQGELWKQYAGAEIINGDRTAIRKINGIWSAFGVPFCGTSKINKNKHAPLKSIVVLQQYPINQVQYLKGRIAFYSIYSELTVNNWNTQFVNNAINWTIELLNEVPIYKLLCTKDPIAVSILEKFMEGGNNK